MLLARAAGRAPTRIPVLLRPGETLRLAFELPMLAAVPPDFVYIPPGRFLIGSRDDEMVRHWFDAAPMHEVSTAAYLIARHETTYDEYIAFLDTLDAEEMYLRRPHSGGSEAVQLESELELRKIHGVWTLSMRPATDTRYTAAYGEPIVYGARDRRAKQDWRKMPVTGISPLDAEAYAAWLDRTGRVPHARLCTGNEWERAARGADGRSYPNGKERLEADDENIDVTYGRQEGGFGLDEVGSHPSVSPFGLYDAAGNAWEFTRIPGVQPYAVRGGGYFGQEKEHHIANRTVALPDLRHLHFGVRICADAP